MLRVGARSCELFVVGALVAGAVLGGCYSPYYKINKPVNGSTLPCTSAGNVNCPVDVDIQWQGVEVKPQPDLTLDGTALPSTTLTSGASSSVGTLKVAPGGHTLLVEGDLTGNNGVQHMSATSTFTVQPSPGTFAITGPSGNVLVERGQCAQVTINVTRMPPFAGAVDLALNSPPPPPAGISAAQVSVAGTALLGSLSICAGASAAPGPSTVKVKGSASGLPDSMATLNLVIGRQTGAFAEANPTPYTNVATSTTSNGGNFRVTVAMVPLGFEASFFRVGSTTRIGPAVTFTKGPTSNLGGAGFCSDGSSLALTRGVVLSGSPTGSSAQNVFSFLDLTAPAPSAIQQEANTTVMHSGGAPYTFQPRVFFSPDCTLAFVVSANALGPSSNILYVRDLVRGVPLGHEVPFETSTFGATLSNSPQNKQQIVVEVDTGTPTASITTIDVP
jgi:hypothetical protein